MADTLPTAGLFLFVAFGMASLFWPARAGVLWNRVVRVDPPLEPAMIRLMGALFLAATVAVWIQFSN